MVNFENKREKSLRLMNETQWEIEEMKSKLFLCLLKKKVFSFMTITANGTRWWLKKCVDVH